MAIDPLILFTMPLALILTSLFLVAFAYDMITFRRRKSKNETVYRCNLCHHIYTGTQRIPLSTCPKCGKQNELIRD